MSNTRSVGSPPRTAVEDLISEFKDLDLTASQQDSTDIDRIVSEFDDMYAAASSAASVEQRSQPHVLRIVWDADGCAYNNDYRRATFFFIHEYKRALDKIVGEKNPTTKQRAVESLLNSLREKMEQGVYQHKTEDEFKQVYDDLKYQATQCIVSLLKTLPLTPEHIAVLDSGDFTSDRWQSLVDYILSLNAKYADTYLQHLKSGQCLNWMMKTYLEIMNSISEELSRYIILSTNNNLIRHIEEIKHEYDKIVIMVGSNRQSYHDDLNCSWVNSTGSFFKDLMGVIPTLQKIFHDKPVEIDQTTMADIQNRLLPGESFGRILAGDSVHAPYHWDEKKGTMLYAFCHRAMVECPGAKVTVKFIDDRADIINGLLGLFSNYYDDRLKGSDLLPKGLVLNLIQYDGKVCYEHVIVGTGEIDPDYMNSSLIMSALSDSASPDGSRFVIDSVDSLSKPDRLRELFQRRDAEKQKVMSMSIAAGGSSSFFAPRRESEEQQSRSYTFGCH